uniref:hypothetical protein n=1 Tax=Bacillus thuringiensis TaxID=1428 RepID=UPI001642B942
TPSFLITPLSVPNKQNQHPSPLNTKHLHKTYPTLTKLQIFKLHQKPYQNQFKKQLYHNFSPHQLQPFQFLSKQQKQFLPHYPQLPFLQRPFSQQQTQLQPTQTPLKLQKSLLQQLLPIQKQNPKQLLKYPFTLHNYHQQIKQPFHPFSIKPHTSKQPKHNLQQLKHHLHLITNLHQTLFTQQFNQLYTQHIQPTMIQKYHFIQQYNQYQQILHPPHYQHFFAQNLYNKPLQPQLQITPQHQIQNIRKTIFALSGLIRTQEATPE